MSKAECDTWWARAQVWVTNNSEYRIQMITNSIIQTAGPSSGKRALEYQVTLTPTNDATATIGFAVHCDSLLGCDPNPWAAGADFKQFVRNGPSTARYVTPQAVVPAPSGWGSGQSDSAAAPAQSRKPAGPVEPATDAAVQCPIDAAALFFGCVSHTIAASARKA